MPDQLAAAAYEVTKLDHNHKHGSKGIATYLHYSHHFAVIVRNHLPLYGLCR